jgi:hypothetical protein
MSLLHGPLFNGASGRLMAPLSLRETFAEEVSSPAYRRSCWRSLMFRAACVSIVGGRIGACCIAGIADNDTVKVIIARACSLSRGKVAFCSELQIVA